MFQVSGAKRFSAIYNSSGALGCSLSHQSVITGSRTSEIQATVVFEDDLIFIAHPKWVGRAVREFLENPDADVLCIANFTKDKPTYFSPNLRRTTDVQTMACYLFKPHMKKHLEMASDLSIKQLIETGGATGILDKKWKILQKEFVFVIPKARLAVQRNSFSDILNRQARYDF
jgi:GR25 family glycosyltransferase involved in LPS biosynthesis